MSDQIQIEENLSIEEHDDDLVRLSGRCAYGYEYECYLDEEESIQLILGLMKMHGIAASEITKAK